jgi:hypothetical protein
MQNAWTDHAEGDGMIDVDNDITGYEAVLRAGGDANTCRTALEILRRWQWDEQLQPASREKARLLVREFGSRY